MQLKTTIKSSLQSFLRSLYLAVCQVAQWSSNLASQVLWNRRRQRIESLTTSTLVQAIISDVLWLVPYLFLCSLAKLSASLADKFKSYYDKVVNNS